MPISHACLACGHDLARERARLDAVLGLWIVRCPRCDRAGVRRRYPMVVAWRRVRRAARALGALALQVFLLTILTIAAGGMIYAFADALVGGRGTHLHELVLDRYRRDPDWLSYEAPYIAIGLGTLGVGIGVWLRAGLGHWRWWIAAAVGTGWLVLLALLPEMTHAVEATHARLLHVDAPAWRPGDVPRTLRIETALLLVAIAMAAMPIGTLGGLMWRRSRAGARRRLLRRRRAARGRG